MIRGDGSIGHYSYPERRPGGGNSLHLFRLALADPEGLARTSGYLARAGIGCTEFTFSQESATTPPDGGDPHQPS